MLLLLVINNLSKLIAQWGYTTVTNNLFPVAYENNPLLTILYPIMPNESLISTRTFTLSDSKTGFTCYIDQGTTAHKWFSIGT